MISQNYKGYMEGADITKIPMNYLAYPSKNVLVHKGTAYSRPGIVNDGTEPTGEDGEINGEWVFKDALGGAKALRTTKSGKLQLKYLGVWITIFEGITPDAEHVRFSEWIDDSGDIIKKRLFFVDGSDKIYEWSGAIGVVASMATSHVTVVSGGSGAATLATLGFDDGTGTPQPVNLIHFTSPGVIANNTAYTNADDGSDLILDLNATPSPAVVAGDLAIGGIITHTDKLTGFNKDDIYTYKNRIVVANFESIRIYFSNVEVKLDFVVPAVDDRTALSPFFINLTQNYTAMITRLNQSTQQAVLWISSIDAWVKVNALLAQDEYGNWVNVEEVSQSERTGALPFAVADYKGDLIYFAQDRTVQRVVSNELLGRDEFKLISDEVENTLKRLNVSKLRIYYRSRYIFILFPFESITLMLDMVEGHFQPPQTLPMGLMSNIDGVEYGHSNTRDETFELLVGHNDLGAKIESVFAFGYYQGKDGQDFRPKSHTMMGVSGRMTQSTKAKVEEFFEADGSKAKETFTIDGSKIKMYTVPGSDSWGAHVWGGASYGGGDDEADPLGRFIAFDKYNDLAWFDFRPILTVTGDEQEFHLLGWFIDDDMANRKIPSELFIPKAET